MMTYTCTCTCNLKTMSSLSLSLVPAVELLQSTEKQDQTQHDRDIHLQSDPAPRRQPVSYS